MGLAHKFRPLMRLAAIGALSLLAAQTAVAQSSYPDRPIRFVVGFAAGGGTDLMARYTAERLPPYLSNQTIVVENKPGAGGIVAATYVKNAAPDGYTLLFGVQGMMSLMPALYPDLPYSTLKDFIPISIVGTLANVVIVANDSPIKSIDDLLKVAKEGKALASGATASAQILLELFQSATGTKFQYAAYKSGMEAIRGVISEGVTMTIIDLSSAIQFIRKGQVRALAITAPQRFSILPDVPTTAELGYPTINAMPWAGVLAPAGTPPVIVGKLQEAVRKVTEMPDYKEKMAGLTVEARANTPDEFRTLLTDEIELWTGVAKKANIKIEQ